jgi:hypothetical protein
MYSVFLLSLPSAMQLSPDVLVHAGFLCDKAAVLGAAIKERSCRNETTSMKMREQPLRIQHLRF